MGCSRQINLIFGNFLEQAIEKLNKYWHSDGIPSGSTRQTVSFPIRFLIRLFVDRVLFVLEIARLNKIRIIGPNCLGLMNPLTGLNATFANAMAKPGSVGFISQSGALCTSILDWSFRENVGLVPSFPSVQC